MLAILSPASVKTNATLRWPPGAQTMLRAPPTTAPTAPLAGPLKNAVTAGAPHLRCGAQADRGGVRPDHGLWVRQRQEPVQVPAGEAARKASTMPRWRARSASDAPVGPL